jgi:hypothetical protein
MLRKHLVGIKFKKKIKRIVFGIEFKCFELLFMLNTQKYLIF